jgi:hypothetical protein
MSTSLTARSSRSPPRPGAGVCYAPKMLQEIMGHASITTTLDLYGHLYPGEMDRYANRLNEAAGMTDAAKMRPDGTSNEISPEGSTR